MTPAAIPWLTLAVELVLAGAAVFIIARLRLHRPAPARLTPAERPPVIPPMMLLEGALVLFLAELLGLATASHLLHLSIDNRSLRDVSLAMLGNYCGFAAGLVVLIAMVPGVTRAIGLRARARDAVSGVIGAAMVIPILFLIGSLGIIVAQLSAGAGLAPPPTETAHDGLRMFVMNEDFGWRLLFGALVVVGAPIAEETIYRGMIQSAFLRASRSPRAAILLTSVLFTMMHIPVVDWFALPAIFTLSIALGIAAERTQRLAAPIVIHGLFNLINLGLALMSGGG